MFGENGRVVAGKTIPVRHKTDHFWELLQRISTKMVLWTSLQRKISEAILALFKFGIMIL